MGNDNVQSRRRTSNGLGDSMNSGQLVKSLSWDASYDPLEVKDRNAPERTHRRVSSRIAIKDKDSSSSSSDSWYFVMHIYVHYKSLRNDMNSHKESENVISHQPNTEQKDICNCWGTMTDCTVKLVTPLVTDSTLGKLFSYYCHRP